MKFFVYEQRSLPAIFIYLAMSPDVALTLACVTYGGGTNMLDSRLSLNFSRRWRWEMPMYPEFRYCTVTDNDKKFDKKFVSMFSRLFVLQRDQMLEQQLYLIRRRYMF